MSNFFEHMCTFLSKVINTGENKYLCEFIMENSYIFYPFGIFEATCAIFQHNHSETCFRDKIYVFFFFSLSYIHRLMEMDAYQNQTKLKTFFNVVFEYSLHRRTRDRVFFCMVDVVEDV